MQRVDFIPISVIRAILRHRRRRLLAEAQKQKPVVTVGAESRAKAENREETEEKRLNYYEQH